MAAGAIIAEAIATGIGALMSWGSASDSNALRQKQLKIQAAQFGLDAMNQYQSFLSTLADLRGSFNQAYLSGLQTQSDIASSEAWLDRYEGYYQYNMAQMNQQGISQYQELVRNWQNQNVISAERGQTGSTVKLLAEIQKQNLANMYGEDLTYNQEKGLLGMAMREARLDLEAEKQTVLNNLNVLNQTNDIQIDTAEELADSLVSASASTAGFADTIGVEQEEIDAVTQGVVDFLTGEGGAYDKIDYLKGSGGVKTDTTGQDINNPIVQTEEIKATRQDQADVIKDTINDKINEGKIPTDLNYKVVSYLQEYGEDSSTVGYTIQVMGDDGKYRTATTDELKNLNNQYAETLEWAGIDFPITAGRHFNVDNGVNSLTQGLISLYATNNDIRNESLEASIENTKKRMEAYSGKKRLSIDERNEYNSLAKSLKVMEQNLKTTTILKTGGGK